jgi:hypothetical protein
MLYECKQYKHSLYNCEGYHRAQLSQVHTDVFADDLEYHRKLPWPVNAHVMLLNVAAQHVRNKTN